MVSAKRFFGKKFCSNGIAKGTGVSKEAQRITGASKASKQCSLIQAEISPPIPPIRQSSCNTTTLPVLRTAASIAL